MMRRSFWRSPKKRPRWNLKIKPRKSLRMSWRIPKTTVPMIPRSLRHALDQLKAATSLVMAMQGMRLPRLEGGGLLRLAQVVDGARTRGRTMQLNHPVQWRKTHPLAPGRAVMPDEVDNADTYRGNQHYFTAYAHSQAESFASTYTLCICIDPQSASALYNPWEDQSPSVLAIPMALRPRPDIDRDKLIPPFELDGLFRGCLTLDFEYSLTLYGTIRYRSAANQPD
jgi:hypothetical protein